MVSIYPEGYIEQQMAHWKARAERFQNVPDPKNAGSYAGMRIQADMELEKWSGLARIAQLDEHDAERKAIIDFLLGRGYSFANSADPRMPHLAKQLGYRQVRVCVNAGGLMILIDPGAGAQFVHGHKYINPNAERLDWGSHFLDRGTYVDNVVALILIFEGYASSEENYELHLAKCKTSVGILGRVA